MKLFTLGWAQNETIKPISPTYGARWRRILRCHTRHAEASHRLGTLAYTYLWPYFKCGQVRGYRSPYVKLHRYFAVVCCQPVQKLAGHSCTCRKPWRTSNFQNGLRPQLWNSWLAYLLDKCFESWARWLRWFESTFEIAYSRSWRRARHCMFDQLLPAHCFGRLAPSENEAARFHEATWTLAGSLRSIPDFRWHPCNSTRLNEDSHQSLLYFKNTPAVGETSL